MSGRVHYTSYVSSTIPVLFKCEHCGKITLINHVLKSESTESAGTFSRHSTHENARSSAEKQAMESNNYLRKWVLEDAEKRNYTKAQFNCRCSNCQKKPLWSQITHTTATKIVEVLLFIAFIIFIYSLICFTDGNTGLGVGIILFPVIPLVVASIIIYAATKHQTKKTEEKILLMDEKYLPIFCTTQEEVIAALEEIRK